MASKSRLSLASASIARLRNSAIWVAALGSFLPAVEHRGQDFLKTARLQ
jgi:hypothetical protein